MRRRAFYLFRPKQPRTIRSPCLCARAVPAAPSNSDDRQGRRLDLLLFQPQAAAAVDPRRRPQRAGAPYATAEEERVRLRVPEAQGGARDAPREYAAARAVPGGARRVGSLLPMLDTLEGEVGEHEEALSTALLHCELLADKLRSQVGERSQVGATAVVVRRRVAACQDRRSRQAARRRRRRWRRAARCRSSGRTIAEDALPPAAAPPGRWRRRRRRASGRPTSSSGARRQTRPTRCTRWATRADAANADEIIFSVSATCTTASSRARSLCRGSATRACRCRRSSTTRSAATARRRSTTCRRRRLRLPADLRAGRTRPSASSTLVYLERLFVTGHAAARLELAGDRLHRARARRQGVDTGLEQRRLLGGDERFRPALNRGALRLHPV